VINIIIEISLYLIGAILLGSIFGWLLAKSILKERYQDQLEELSEISNHELGNIDKINQELEHYKKVNQELIEKNMKLNLGYMGQKYVLDENNETLDEFQVFLKSKDDVIETLTSKLSGAEEKQMKMKKKHDVEIDAFLFERIEITQKYKDLLVKYDRLKKHKEMIHEESWFSKLFSIHSKS